MGEQVEIEHGQRWKNECTLMSNRESTNGNVDCPVHRFNQNVICSGNSVEITFPEEQNNNYTSKRNQRQGETEKIPTSPKPYFSWYCLLITGLKNMAALYTRYDECFVTLSTRKSKFKPTTLRSPKKQDQNQYITTLKSHEFSKKPNKIRSCLRE